MAASASNTDRASSAGKPLDSSAPRTDQVAEALARMLKAGELGEPLPPERQLAVLFGVSRITLRRAMAKLEENGVIRREQGRGTYASDGPAMLTPDQLSQNSKSAIAVLVRQQGKVFNPQLTPWTWRICCEMTSLLAGSDVELCLVNDDQFLAAMSRGRFENVVGFIAPTHQWDTDRYESAMQSDLPWVGLGRTSRSMFWNIVDPDWGDALREAIEDLRPTSQDQVYIPIVPHPCEVDQQCWIETALAELVRHGVPRRQIFVHTDGPFESQCYLATRSYLRQVGGPTLVLAPFDLSVVGVYRALQTYCDSGLEDTRFLGAADLEISRYLSPQLSTLSIDYRRVSQHILDMLEAQRHTGDPCSLHFEPAYYIRRESSRVVA